MLRELYLFIAFQVLILAIGGSLGLVMGEGRIPRKGTWGRLVLWSIPGSIIWPVLFYYALYKKLRPRLERNHA